MRTWAVWLLAAGCNQVFGLEKTHLAGGGSATPDAPFTCPGAGPPKFQGSPNSLMASGCEGYIVAGPARLASATCGLVSPQTFAAIAAVDAPLSTMSAIQFTPATTAQIDQPALAPEGNLAFMRRLDTSGAYVHAVFTKNPDGTWTEGQALPLVGSNAGKVGAPTRGPGERRVMAYNEDWATTVPSHFVEFTDQGTGTWKQHDSYEAASDFQLTAFADATPNLTEDGLRLVFIGTTTTSDTIVAYSERPNIGARFGKAVALQAPTAILRPYMTEDCGRLYFDGALATIQYVEQAAP